MQAPNPVRSEEVPIELRDSLLFSRQYRRQKDNRLVIVQKCKMCGRTKELFPCTVRHLLREKLYDGYCHHCSLKARRSQPLLKPEDVSSEIRGFLNFENQPIESKQGRLIEARCPGCQKSRMVLISFFKSGFLKSTYCHPCACRKHSLFRKINRAGYVYILTAGLSGRARELVEQSSKKSKSRVSEHWLVMSLHLDRPLKGGEIVHHKDGNRQNNSLDNLQLLKVNTHHNGHGTYYQEWQEALAEVGKLKQQLVQTSIPSQ